MLTVGSNTPAEIWIDDQLAGNAPGQLLLPAGRYTVELRAPGYLRQRGEAEIAAGQELALAFELARAPAGSPVTEPAGLDPTLFWIGAGATAATALIGGYFGLRALALHDDAIELPAVHPERARKRREVEDAEAVADAFFAASALLAIGTTVVLLATDWDAARRDEESPPPRVRIAPALAPGAAGLAVGGRL